MLEPLTPRQLEVLHVIVRGASNAEIAAQLNVSTKTIESHVADILSKTGARNRTELTFMAFQEGLVKDV